MMDAQTPPDPSTNPLVSVGRRLGRLASVFFLMCITADLMLPLFLRLPEKFTPMVYDRLNGLAIGLRNAPALERASGKTVVDLSNPQMIVVEFPETDPWGTPYRAVLTLPDYQVTRVYSCGPDGVSQTSGRDRDDIDDKFARQESEWYRNVCRTWISLGMSAWGVFLVWVVVIRRRPENGFF